MRLLLDTNVLVAGLMSPNGPPGRLLRAWVFEGRFDLITSGHQLAELARVLERDRIRARIPEHLAASLPENLDDLAIVATDLPSIDLSPDPNDNPILAAAVAGEADALVSGDRTDVLDLKQVRGIPIISPRVALALIGLAGEHSET